MNKLSNERANLSKKIAYGSGTKFYTRNLIVERTRISDLDFFKKVVIDSTITQYFKEYQFTCDKDAESFFNKEIIEMQSTENVYCVIRNRDEMPIGFWNLFSIIEREGVWMTEYAILEPFRRRGYMTEVFDYFYDNIHLFSQTLGTNPCFCKFLLEISDDNIESKKFLKKFERNHKLAGEFCTSSFYRFLEGQPGEGWYRISL